MKSMEFPPSMPPKVEGTAEDLSGFIESMGDNNIFKLTKDLSLEVLEARKGRLDVLLEQFETATPEERTELEKTCPEFAGMATITPEAATFIADVRDNPRTDIKAGAENENYIFPDAAGEKHVLKMSKGRHDYDAVSVVKLMRNMYALEIFERQYRSFGSQLPGEIDINMEYESMVIYKDAEGHYKRLIKQAFVEGLSVGDILGQGVVPEDFQVAWQKFLEQIGLLQATSEVSLDITDSTQGAKPSRGNVARTNNVIVETPGELAGNYVFHVIDLDVFDDPLWNTLGAKGRQHKFYATEQLRKKGSILGAVKVFLTNMSREFYVKPMQDRYIKKELEK